VTGSRHSLRSCQSKGVTQFFAALLILLGVSPFTAPFSTCDLGTLQGDPSSMLALDPLGAIGKPAADPGDAPVTVGAAAAAVAHFIFVRNTVPTLTSLVPSVRLVVRVLRI
jgi:hypothetical protein